MLALGQNHSVTIAGRQTDELLAALGERRLADVELSAEPSRPREWEARMRAVPGRIKGLPAAFDASLLSDAIVLPPLQALEPEQVALERERPPGPSPVTRAPRRSPRSPWTGGAVV